MSELSPLGFLASNVLVLGLYMWVTHTKDPQSVALLLAGLILGHVWQALFRAWRADRNDRARRPFRGASR